MSSSSTSRWVTARSTSGRSVGESSDALLPRARRSPRLAPRPRRATSICTKFVSTRSRSTGRPAAASPRRAAGRARGRRRAARRGGRARRARRPRRSRPGASRRRRGTSGARRVASRSAGPARTAPSGQPSPFERQSVTVSTRARRLGGRHAAARPRRSAAARRRGARARPSSRAAARQRGELVERPDAAARAAVRVLEHDDARRAGRRTSGRAATAPRPGPA